MTMPKNKWLLACALWLALAAPGWALIVEQPLADPAQEARAQALFHEIRCVVCQSEAVADSQATVAVDMRRLIRQRIQAGQSDAAIKDYLVSRYGDFVLMTPPFKSQTWLLWLSPLIVLVLGALMAWRYFYSSSCGARPLRSPRDDNK